MTRQEHLDWAKQRALEYVERGDIPQAITSIGSDLEKHPETRGHKGTQLGVMLLMAGSLQTIEDAKRFIHHTANIRQGLGAKG
jgi:hypothetical protein